MNPDKAKRELKALYDELPHIECRGKCWDSCGPIEMSVIERRQVEAALGKPLAVTDGVNSCLTCNALTPLGTCSVYEVRPMVCRLWGMTETMRCPYGCVPEGGHLSDEEGFSLLGRALEIGGAPPEWGPQLRSVVEATANPALMAEAKSYLQKPKREHD